MEGPAAFRIGNVRVDLEESRVEGGGHEQTLTKLETDLLACLFAHRGRTVGREQLLSEVWGYSPLTVTRAVDNTISRLRRKIEADPARPRWIVSSRGGGYRLEAEPDDVPPGLGNLPAPRDVFVGRVHERAGIDAALGAGRLLTLIGPGGIGKTRLACEVARRHGARLPGGAWIADLTAARGPDGVLSAVAMALHVPLRLGDPRAQLTNALAARGSMLLLLDNCDHVADETADFASAALDRAPDLVVLATSREPLRLRGEQRWPVEPLPVPAGHGLQEVEDSDAVTLFVHRGRAVRPDFALTAARAPSLARLVRLLDGLPLAIELAAAHAGRWELHELADSLQQRLDALVIDERDRPDHHRSVTAALDWSWAQLSRVEQHALARLTVFEGGCTPAAAAAVVGGTEPEATIASLVDKSLVRRMTSAATGGERLGMFSTIRTWARDKLSQAAAREAEVRHGAHYARFADDDERAALWRVGGAQRRRIIEEERDNLLVAVHRAVAREDADQAVALCTAAWEILSASGPIRVGVALAEAVLGMAELSAAGRGRIEQIAGLAHDRAGNWNEGMAHYEASLAAARSLGERDLEARAIGSLGILYWRIGRVPEAAVHYQRALDIARDLDDPAILAASMTNLGHLCEGRGEPERARALHEEALAIDRAIGDRRSEGHVACQLAISHARQGRFDEAAALFGTAIEAARELGDRWTEAIVLGNLGSLALDRGDPGSASALLEEALAIHVEVGDRRSEGVVRSTLGELYAEEGRTDKAYHQLRLALSIAREARDQIRVGRALGWLGVTQAARGERSEAERSFTEGADLLREVEQIRDLALHAALRARSEHLWGEREAARRSLEEARRLAQEASMEPGSGLARMLDRVEALIGA